MQRIETGAPPIQLYNMVFSQFLDDIANENLEVPTKVIQANARLINLASLYENEAQRRIIINTAAVGKGTSLGDNGNISRQKIQACCYLY